jgi:hypothetical protein
MVGDHKFYARAPFGGKGKRFTLIRGWKPLAFEQQPQGVTKFGVVLHDQNWGSRFRQAR